MEPAPRFLVTFSNGVGSAGPIPAGQIFSELINLGRWYLPRRSSIAGGATILFYQAGVGIRGEATVLNVLEATQNDRDYLKKYGLFHLTVRLALGQQHVFEEPVSLAPLVNDLAFVTNKKYWGHSLRFTPRVITEADYNLIVQRAVAA